MPLLELIVKTGIAAAVNSLPDGIKRSKAAVAETIANNVRSRIIKDHLSDPAYYDRMSTLLEEIIADLRAKRIDYEEYLKRVAALAKNVASGVADDTPDVLKRSAGLRAIYNNLKILDPGSVVKEDSPGYESSGDPLLDLAQRLDRTVRLARPDGWRGVVPKEQVIKQALFYVLENVDHVERLFAVIKQQPEY